MGEDRLTARLLNTMPAITKAIPIVNGRPDPRRLQTPTSTMQENANALIMGLGKIVRSFATGTTIKKMSNARSNQEKLFLSTIGLFGFIVLRSIRGKDNKK